jgi:Tfp pilus assembly protein PilO
MINGQLKRRRVSIWGILLRFSVTILITCFVLYFGYSFLRQYRLYQEKCRTRDILKEKILSKEIEIQKLRDSIIRIDNDPEFAERVAREEGRIAPDESVVRTTNPLLLHVQSPTTGGIR